MAETIPSNPLPASPQIQVFYKVEYQENNRGWMIQGRLPFRALLGEGQIDVPGDYSPVFNGSCMINNPATPEAPPFQINFAIPGAKTFKEAWGGFEDAAKAHIKASIEQGKKDREEMERKMREAQLLAPGYQTGGPMSAPLGNNGMRLDQQGGIVLP